jgi:hypothetical protein
MQCDQNSCTCTFARWCRLHPPKAWRSASACSERPSGARELGLNRRLALKAKTRGERPLSGRRPAPGSGLGGPGPI